MKRIALIAAFVVALLTFVAPVLHAPVFDATPAVAQGYNPHGSVGTGGSMAAQHGVRHAQSHYEEQCRRLGNPRPGCYGPRHHGRPMYHRRPPAHVHRGHGYRYGHQYHDHRRAVVRPRPAPLPSPAAIASRVPHKTSRVCVPCVGGYTQDPNTCECMRVRWVPGPPPR